MTEPNYPVPDRAPEGNRRIAVHDEIEAAAFARVATASATSPVVAALLAYAEVEATALIRANIQIVHALVEALIEAGSQSGDEVDGIVARTVSTQALAIGRANRNDWRRRKQPHRLQQTTEPRTAPRPRRDGVQNIVPSVAGTVGTNFR